MKVFDFTSGSKGALLGEVPRVSVGNCAPPSRT